MKTFDSNKLSARGGKARGSVEVYFKEKAKDTTIFCASGQDALVTALSIVTNNQIDALDSIVVRSGDKPIFCTSFN